MKKVIIKKCIICDREFVKYAYKNEKGMKRNDKKNKNEWNKHSPQSEKSITCSKVCSRRITNIIASIKGRKWYLKLDMKKKIFEKIKMNLTPFAELDKERWNDLLKEIEIIIK